MGDEYQNISYFLYELDYGRKYVDGMIIKKDETIIVLGSLEKLYEYLKMQK